MAAIKPEPPGGRSHRDHPAPLPPDILQDLYYEPRAKSAKILLDAEPRVSTPTENPSLPLTLPSTSAIPTTATAITNVATTKARTRGGPSAEVRELRRQLAHAKELLRAEIEKRKISEQELENLRRWTYSRGEHRIRHLLEIQRVRFTTPEAAKHLRVKVSYASRICARATRRGYLKRVTRNVWEKIPGVEYPGCCRHRHKAKTNPPEPASPPT